MAEERKDDLELARLIEGGESDTVEFKEAACWNRHKNAAQKDQMFDHIRITVASFLNTEGGTVLIGVDDKGHPVGVEDDYLQVDGKNRDGYELYLNNKLAHAFGQAVVVSFIKIRFGVVNGVDVCCVKVEPSPTMVYLDEDKGWQLYVRIGNSHRSLPLKEAIRYNSDRQQQQAAGSEQQAQASPSEYPRYISDANGSVDLPGVGGRFSLSIKQLFVNLQAARRVSDPDSSAEKSLAKLKEELTKRHTMSEVAKRELFDNYDFNYRAGLEMQPEQLSLSDAVNAHSPLVILGEPGAGKTTLLRHLTYTNSLRREGIIRRGADLSRPSVLYQHHGELVLPACFCLAGV